METRPSPLWLASGNHEARQSGPEVGGGGGGGGMLEAPGAVVQRHLMDKVGSCNACELMMKRWCCENIPLFISVCCSQCRVIITQHFEAGKHIFLTLLSRLFSVLWVWMGRGGHWCNVYCLCMCFMCFRLWTCYFSLVYFVWHFVLLCGWHMEWWSCVKNWFKTLVNTARRCYWKRTSGWWFHHIIKEWKSIANYILKQTTYYTIIFNYIWTLSGWAVR